MVAHQGCLAVARYNKAMDKQYPKIVVGCFILNAQNELLLCRSYKWPSLWVVMGGHIEWGEHIKDAVAREVQEELGLTVTFDHVVEVAEFVFPKEFHEQRHFVGLQCLCRVVNDPTPRLDYDEIQEARYFTLDQALKLPDLLPATRHTIHVLVHEVKKS